MKATREPLLILASASPRRRELLGLGGWEFVLRPTEVNESQLADESPESMAVRLAETKAQANRAPAGGLTLGADTIVVFNGQVLGKPRDRDDARRMLRALRGRTHIVVTGLAVADSQGETQARACCTTEVVMRDYSDDQVEAYLDSGAPLDKAGGYGIQDHEFRPVATEHMSGCYANVMGLPLCHATRALAALELPARHDVPQACRGYTGYACTVFPQILGRKP